MSTLTEGRFNEAVGWTIEGEDRCFHRLGGHELTGGHYGLQSDAWVSVSD